MQAVPHNPTEGVYAATDDYVHAMEVRGADRLLFVAGTMGLDPAGVPGATLDEQLDLIWSNIRTILASAGMTADNIVRLTSYLRDASSAEANAAARIAALGGQREGAGGHRPLEPSSGPINPPLRETQPPAGAPHRGEARRPTLSSKAASACAPASVPVSS